MVDAKFLGSDQSVQLDDVNYRTQWCTYEDYERYCDQSLTDAQK